MVTVGFLRDASSRILGFEARGHADAGEYGSDIVCAAVSSLTQATLYGLRDVLKVPVMFDEDEEAGLAVFLIAGVADSKIADSQVLFKTLLGSLQAIESDYPKNVRIIFKERR